MSHTMLLWPVLTGSVSLLSIAILVAEAMLSHRIRVRRRMQAEFGAGRPDVEHRSPLFKEPEQPWSIPPDVSLAALPQPGLLQRLELMITQAGMRLTVGRLFLLSGVASVSAGVVASLLGIHPIVAGLLAFGAAAVPFGYVRYRWRARRERLLRQLPDAFELMARVVRAGQSMPQAFQAVSEEFKGPVAAEFSCCFEQQNLGLPFDVALRDLAVRTGILEVQVFVMALLVHHETGGNLTLMLDKLATVVRCRLLLHNKVQVITAEGRMQATVLLALPPLAFVGMLILNYSYIEVLLQHPDLLYGIGAALLVGALWIRRIVQVDL